MLTPMLMLVPIATNRWKSPSPQEARDSLSSAGGPDGSSGELSLSEQAESVVAAAMAMTC